MAIAERRSGQLLKDICERCQRDAGKGADQKSRLQAAIVIAATECMTSYHDRMPAILAQDSIDKLFPIDVKPYIYADTALMVFAVSE